MKKVLLVVIFLLTYFTCISQGGYNHQWLVGYWPPPYFCGRMIFDSSSYGYNQEIRKMAFNDTQGNICDANGNFLMSSNGVWIANATNDTMMNGSGLNPGYDVLAHPNGSYLPTTNIFLPFQSDTNTYILVHQTNLDANSSYGAVYTSLIDLSLDSGKGAVVSKNNLIYSDTLSYGITAVKHANGNDWWVVGVKDSSDLIYSSLVTKSGVLMTNTQHLGFSPVPYENISQVCFNRSGNNFAYTIYDNPVSRNSSIVLCDFDRCSGYFSNTRVISICSGSYIWGLAFSPDGSKIYANTSNEIFQIQVSTLVKDTVAIYDGFYYLFPALATTFMEQYLAANGKIYLTTGNGTQHLHEINYPDSAGIACDVQQHAVNLGVWNFRSVPNHPNYNLGPVVGSVCDTLGVGLPEMQHDFHFGISPNPVVDGPVKIIYLLPENKSGIFEVYNITGQLVYKMNLPPWSTLQYVELPRLSEGVYTAVVRSGYERSAKKLVVMK